MTGEADFSDVAAAAGRGEHWALTDLFRAYQPPLLRYLRAQAPDAADDLASEVWIGAAKGLAGFSGDEAAFRGWLFTIARRRLIDHRRRTGRQRTDATPAEELEVVVDMGPGGDPVAAVLGRLGAQRAIDALIAELPADQAEAVLLRVVGGLSVAEVARIMQRPPGTVRVLCHRALRRLAVRYGDEVAIA
jgi:RNA polymerase sigma-70 factor (ECF subfamily)